MIEIVINGTLLTAAQHRWMLRLARGEMNFSEAHEKIDLLPKTQEGFECLWMYLSNVGGDDYAWEVLVDRYWEYLTRLQKKHVVKEVKFLFEEEIWRDILWRIPREERTELMQETEG